MRHLKSVLALTLITCLCASMAFAVEGNSRKGKFLYRKHCRTCHGVYASDLSPSSKVQADWKKLYANMGTIPCQKDWGAISDADKKDIFSYLHEFAKDSPTPASCQ